MRRYAEDTTVAISKSRAEIDALLRAWGADAVQWTDEWSKGKIALRFLWRSDGVDYHARFSIDVGLVAAEAIFLPFLEDSEGMTVAERVVPNLSALLTMRADRMLGAAEVANGR